MMEYLTHRVQDLSIRGLQVFRFSPLSRRERVTRFATALLLALFTSGCASHGITFIGRVPNSDISCHAVKDKDLIIAADMILCLDKNGNAVAAAGGAAPGLIHPLGTAISGVATGAGFALGGAFIGSGIKALNTIDIRGQIIPNAVNIKPVLPPVHVPEGLR